METYKNNQNEIITKWESFKHPENPNFMQRVLWMMIEKPDGRVSVGYKLDYNGKTKFIFGLTKEEILNKFN